MEYCSALRKVEILPFITTWMGLEKIMLRKISQSEKGDFSHMWDVKLNVTDTEKSMWLPEGRGRDRKGSRGPHMWSQKMI